LIKIGLRKQQADQNSKKPNTNIWQSLVEDSHDTGYTTVKCNKRDQKRRKRSIHKGLNTLQVKLLNLTGAR
jgi:hypothetical protein